MINSFGIHVIRHFCHNGLTVPIIARAIGVSTGTLERAMATNNPSVEMVGLLTDLSEHTWFFGVDKLTSDDIWKWVADWDVANKDERMTVTQSTWEEPQIRATPDPDPGTDKKAWLLRNPALTFEAWEKTWNYFSGDVLANEALRAFRWRPYQESDKGVTRNVWRWNPLELPAPSGRPYKYFQSPSERAEPIVSMKPHLIAFRREKVRNIVNNIFAAGHTQVRFQDVVIAYHGRPTKAGRALQVLRDDLTFLGLEYNVYDKVWRLKKPQ